MKGRLLLLLLLLPSLAGAATIAGRDMGGQNLICGPGSTANDSIPCSPNDVLSGVFTNVGLFQVNAGTTVFVTPATPLVIFASTISIPGLLNGSGRGEVGGIGGDPGQPGGDGDGRGPGIGATTSMGGGGGGYGGAGGNGSGSDGVEGDGGSAYDDPAAPVSIGSIAPGSGGGGGGGSGVQTGGSGGQGGASIYLESSSFTLTGTIFVRGVPGGNSTRPADAGGGGAGGGLLLRCADLATVSGTINASGGKGGDAAGGSSDIPYPGGGGGGGRVKIYYRQAAFSVSISTAGGAKGIKSGNQNEGSPNAQPGLSGAVSFGVVASSPTNLAFAALFSTSVTWSWAAAPNWGNAPEASRNYRLYSGTVSYRTPDRAPQLVVSSASVSVTETGLTPNTAYTRYATAFTDNSDSLPSNTVSTYTLAGLPGAAASTFTAVTAVSLNLNWSAGSPANPGYTSYEVNRSTGLNFGLAVSTSFVTALSSAPAGLAPNTTYCFRVRALNLDAVATDFTPETSTSTLAVAPVSPSFVQVSSTSLVFNWSGGNPPQTLYIAEISTDNFATLSRSSGTLNTAAAFTDLEVNALYYARVKARNHDGVDTAFTADITTFTITSTPLNSPAPFTNLSAGALTFNWASGGNSAGITYNPEISTSSNFSAPVSSDTTINLNHLFAGLSANTTYYARVRALGAGGLTSLYSSPVVSTVTLALPPLASAAPFTSVFAGSFTFNWADGGNPDGTLYTAEISRDGFVSVFSAVRTSALSAAFPALTANTVYQARVKAVNFLGVDGPYSSPIRATATLAMTPLNAEQPFTSVSATTVTFTWADGGNPGGTSYAAELSSAGFAPGTVISSAATLALSQTFSGLLPNRTYYGRVRAVNMENIPSGDSPLVAVVTLPLHAALTSPPFSGVNSSGLTLGWTAGGNPQNTTYVAEISGDNFVSVSRSSTTVDLTAAFMGLTPNTTYTARIKAVNFAGSAGPYSSPAVSTATLAVAPLPAAPTFTLTDNGITALWAAGGNPPGTLYEAEVSTRPDFSPLLANTAMTAASSGFTLAANTTYYARVRARNYSGIPTAELDLGSVLTYAAAPAVLASTTTGPVSVTTFSFVNTVSTGAGGLLFYRTAWDRNATHAWNDQEQGWTALGVLTTTATGNGYWYLHLRSYNFSGAGYKTADVGPFLVALSTVMPPGLPIPAPGAFTATSGITWNWPPAVAFGDTAISTYIVSVGTSPADFSVLADYPAGPLTSFTLDPAANGQTYYLKVKAVDEVGVYSQYSPVSNPGVLVDRTAPGHPAGAVQADRRFSYDARALFSWPAAADPESGIKDYLLDLGTTPNGSDILNAKNTGLATTYQATGLPSGKSVFARVRAENNAGGVSNYSDAGPGVPVWTLDQAPPMAEPYNWPNPFDPAAGPTQIGFFLAAPAKVTLKLFTLEGNLVLEETRAEGAAGNKTWPWAGRNGAGKIVAPGGYICVLEKRYGGKTERQQFKLAVLY